MNLLTWNNAEEPQGKDAEPTASHRVQGLEARNVSPLPVEGEVFLDIPFINQPITLKIS
ncbi:MAG TPA: hypothetical protein VMU26_25670 [Candidatus Polarisedimenticolia bacterium]|nr:hypothetical protein [Candidatus Polarisedimenticolia bacterium]